MSSFPSDAAYIAVVALNGHRMPLANYMAALWQDLGESVPRITIKDASFQVPATLAYNRLKVATLRLPSTQATVLPVARSAALMIQQRWGDPASQRRVIS